MPPTTLTFVVRSILLFSQIQVNTESHQKLGIQFIPPHLIALLMKDMLSVACCVCYVIYAVINGAYRFLDRGSHIIGDGWNQISSIVWSSVE